MSTIPPPIAYATPFPAWSIMLPPPLAFPREAFVDALAEHARLVEKHSERLLELTRETATASEPHVPVVDLTGIIVAGGKNEEDIVWVVGRGDAANQVVSYRGILSRLLFRSDEPELPILVVAGRAISLWVARIMKAANGGTVPHHQLIVESRERIVEPFDQEHRESGLGPLMVTRWVHPDGEARYAWVPIPPTPASDEEAMDRVLALHRERVQQKLEAFRREHGEQAEPLVFVMSTPDHGDGLDVCDRSTLPEFATYFSGIARAIVEGRHPGRVPVFVFMGLRAGLRWVAFHGENRSDAPAMIIEAMRGPDPPAEDEEEPPDDAAKPEKPAKPHRKPSAVQVLRAIERSADFDEIDTNLGRMSEEELDREIAMVGFDPKEERARGPGVRECVVAKISDRRWGEEPL